MCFWFVTLGLFTKTLTSERAGEAEGMGGGGGSVVAALQDGVLAGEDAVHVPILLQRVCNDVVGEGDAVLFVKVDRQQVVAHVLLVKAAGRRSAGASRQPSAGPVAPRAAVPIIPVL